MEVHSSRLHSFISLVVVAFGMVLPSIALAEPVQVYCEFGYYSQAYQPLGEIRPQLFKDYKRVCTTRLVFSPKEVGSTLQPIVKVASCELTQAHITRGVGCTVHLTKPNRFQVSDVYTDRPNITKFETDNGCVSSFASPDETIDMNGTKVTPNYNGAGYTLVDSRFTYLCANSISRLAPE